MILCGNWTDLKPTCNWFISAFIFFLTSFFNSLFLISWLQWELPSAHLSFSAAEDSKVKDESSAAALAAFDRLGSYYHELPRSFHSSWFQEISWFSTGWKYKFILLIMYVCLYLSSLGLSLSTPTWWRHPKSSPWPEFTQLPLSPLHCSAFRLRYLWCRYDSAHGSLHLFTF